MNYFLLISIFLIYLNQLHAQKSGLLNVPPTPETLLDYGEAQEENTVAPDDQHAGIDNVIPEESHGETIGAEDLVTGEPEASTTQKAKRKTETMGPFEETAEKYVTDDRGETIGGLATVERAVTGHTGVATDENLVTDDQIQFATGAPEASTYKQDPANPSVSPADGYSTAELPDSSRWTTKTARPITITQKIDQESNGYKCLVNMLEQFATNRQRFPKRHTST
ncbi:unnamed protein product [Caenorhabditis bovis]|uniref:Uncharacterized protein n=1 Tax=Caenorhabditis bovis TaxID=2654633 RepID=A0A8S1F719_9PELO|nr:unnamed protein product [Caenorhabditis bovis]